MKYNVRIADKNYEVEIEDIFARPIIAHVEGQSFEVHPENMNQPTAASEPTSITIQKVPESSVGSIGAVHELTAPLPGTIVELFIRNGEEIEAGNIVLIIEAMKMKNSIRSTRSGKVAEVLVHVGETVAHKQALVRFEA